MDNNYVLQKIRQYFDGFVLGYEELSGILTITVKPVVINDLISYLKKEPEPGFGFLTDICGIHYPDQENELGVVYLLHNMKNNMRIRIKTFVTKEYPIVPTITWIYAAANWMERETYDFYGIEFEGHPNLKRILNVEYLDYFPMRKEYALEDPTREDKDNRYFGR